jgi:hypothetical protein
LVNQVVIANSTFITNAAQNKSMHTSSAIRQVTASSAVSATTEVPVGAPLISMNNHPTVSHDNIANDCNDESSTGTVTHMVHYVQAIHVDPYDVSIVTDYNRALLEEINGNWDDGPSDPPARVPALTHISFNYNDAPPIYDYGCFYDALGTAQVKSMLVEW